MPFCVVIILKSVGEIKYNHYFLFSRDNKKYFVTLHASEIMMLMSENQLDKNFPQMSFEELEDCMPLEVAFDKLRDKARKYYASNS